MTFQAMCALCCLHFHVLIFVSLIFRVTYRWLNFLKTVFIARQHTDAQYDFAILYVCLSVCHLVFYGNDLRYCHRFFIMSIKHLGEIPMGSPPAGH